MPGRRVHVGILVCVLAAATAWVGLSLIDALPDSTSLGVGFALAAVIGAVVVAVATGNEPSLSVFSQPYILFVLFLAQFYVVGPIAVSVDRSFNHPFSLGFGTADMLGALTAGGLVIVTSLLGFRSRLGLAIADKIPELSWSPRKLPGSVIVAALIMLGFVGCGLWITHQGGLVERLSTGYGRGSSSPVVRIAFAALQIGMMLWLWTLLAARRASIAARVAFAGLLLVELFFFSVVVGARKYVFFFFFGLATVWLLRRGRGAVSRALMVGALVGLVGYFGLWAGLRKQPIFGSLSNGAGMQVAGTSGFEEGYLDSIGGPFAAASVVWRVFPEYEHYRFGRTLLVTVLGFVPRSVWPEKPIGIGKELTRYILGPFYGSESNYSVTVTFPADLYLNFAWPGVLIGGFLAGAVCRAVTVYAMHGRVGGQQFSASRVLIPAGFMMGLPEVRTDMAVALMTYLLIFCPLLCALAFFNLDSKSPPRSDSAIREEPSMPG